MILKILELISFGGMTFTEMARKLEIWDSELRGRLEAMEHAGFLEASQGGEHNTCQSCYGSKCSVCEPDRGSKNVAYRLTEKGVRCLND